MTPDQLLAAPARPTFDGWGRYLLRLPGEPKPKGRTRVTTFAGTLDEKDALLPWNGSRVLLGYDASSSLRAQHAALTMRYGDPWYASETAKAEVKAIVKACAEKGGSTERRDMGTALHDILNAAITGKVLVDDIPVEFRPVVEDVLEMVASRGLTFTEWAEVSVYIPEFDLVGTLDAIVDGALGLLVADFKTGGSHWAPRRKDGQQVGWVDAHAPSDLAEACQLALYAQAKWIIGWPEDPQDECTLTPMPPVDVGHGIVVHCPATGGGVALRHLDLDVAREVCEVIAQVRKYRSAKVLLSRDGPPEPSKEADLRRYIAERIELVKAAGHGAHLARLWPRDVPTFKQSQDHTWEQLEAIDKAVCEVESDHLMPFHDAPDPRMTRGRGR